MNKIKLLFFLCLFLMGHANTKAQQGKEAPAQESLIYQLNLRKEIGSTSWIHTLAAFEKAQQENADCMVIWMNTYGGQVIFADSIRTKILNSPIPVYVFIDNNAASAGALIAIACDSIYMRPGANIGAATVVNQTGEAMPDKYQSYMRATIRATAEAHGKDTIITPNDTIVKWVRDPQIAEAMVDQTIYIPQVSDTGKVLTFTALEAIKFNYCEGLANNMEEVIDQLGYQDYTLKVYQPSFYDGLKGFLTNPIFHGILIMIIIAGIYFELQTPGVGFPLLAAIIAALLYFAPLYVDGLAANWEIVIFILGLLLIGLEIFVIPGFGIAGISGIILVILGLSLSMLDNDFFNFEKVDMRAALQAMGTVVISLVLAIISSLYLTSRMVSKGRLSRLTLTATQETEAGFIGVAGETFNLVGETGIADTVLRPSGKILIKGNQYDAKSEFGFIDKGTPIKVTRFETGQLYVVPLKE